MSGQAPTLPMAALRWRARRGMLELDVLLQRFLQHGYAQTDSSEQALFASLLELEDDCLWAWLGGQVVPPNPRMAALVEQIRSYR